MHELLRSLMTGIHLCGDVPFDVSSFLKYHGQPPTVAHCKAVAEESERLATAFGVNETQAKLAGWLHDVSAIFPTEERVEIAQALDVDVLPEEHAAPMILHQKLSVVLARQIFGVKDKGVLRAVACHTTLRAGATPLDKVLFIADKVAWDQPGAPPYQAALREAITHSLDAAALCYLSYLWERRETLLVVHPWMAEAYADLRTSTASMERWESMPNLETQTTASAIQVAVLISAKTEWRYVCAWASLPRLTPSPYGQWFIKPLQVGENTAPVIFFHGGWGKIDAAASTQYVIDRWSPELIVNLGTCGGFQGVAKQGDIVLAERTLVYDIIEQMGDPDEALAHYTTDLDLSWLSQPYPQAVRQTLLISADRDLVTEEIPALQARFGAVAGDWESGAIAHVAKRNKVRCLILRGVTDLVGPQGGEAYDGTLTLFRERTACVMAQLLEALPDWLASALSH